jgi:predicted transcriptional regulator of viral defense system
MGAGDTISTISITASNAILERLAMEQRHVLSAWRAVLLLRRATFSIPPHERRWKQLPQYPEDISPLIRQMRARKEIRSVPGHSRLYEVVVPYARQGFLDEREVLFEINPYSVLSHLSALVFHGLTTDEPRIITITVSADGTGGLLPIGTSPNDWEGVLRPTPMTPTKVLGRQIQAKRVKPEWFFGFADYEPLGFVMRYTGPERTLIDGLMTPDLCGGIDTVLKAWANARDLIDLDALIYQVERLQTKVLRQRVGFILDQLDLAHSHLELWRAGSHRGGSSRLVASEPFASTFDDRWNLSINVPIDTLFGDS